jgi:putative hydrolase of HD superfamily
MWVKDEEQYENDSEHGYQLAMVAMYIIENDKLKLDAYRAMALALVHDILEVHAGDTFAYGKATDSQHEREAEAVRLLKQQWPGQELMLSLIDEYESKGSSEAKFVYALDKLVPILNNVLDNGRNWRHERITLNQLIEVKAKKISVDKDVQRYYEHVVDLLRERPELFEVVA